MQFIIINEKWLNKNTNSNLKVISNSYVRTSYVLYPTRYIMLALFAMAELCNTAVYATCNPLANEA